MNLLFALDILVLKTIRSVIIVVLVCTLVRVMKASTVVGTIVSMVLLAKIAMVEIPKLLVLDIRM